MCELTHGMAGEQHGNGMGAAWARHAMCESAFLLPLSTADLPHRKPGKLGISRENYLVQGQDKGYIQCYRYQTKVFLLLPLSADVISKNSTFKFFRIPKLL